MVLTKRGIWICVRARRLPAPSQWNRGYRRLTLCDVAPRYGFDFDSGQWAFGRSTGLSATRTVIVWATASSVSYP
jgi:hypothetical protein